MTGIISQEEITTWEQALSEIAQELENSLFADEIDPDEWLSRRGL